MGEPAPFAAMVLCGGAALRMGRDKATLILDGVTLLDRALAVLRPIAEPLLIASGAADHQRPGCVTVADETPARGPLGGIVAALDASASGRCAVVAVDMPDIDAGLLQALAQRCAGVDAVVPLSERGPEPLHAVYARSALSGLRRTLATDDVSMASALAGLRVRYVVAAALGAAPGFACNVNRVEDVRAWLDRRPAAGPPPR